MASEGIDKTTPAPDPATPVETLWSPDQLAATFTSYELTVSYIDHRNVLPQPLAGPDYTRVAHIKLQSKTTTVRVAWSATRSGANPVCPDPEPPAGSNYVLLTAVITPSAPRILPDGRGRVFRIGGVYEYSLQIPKSTAGPFLSGAMPFEVTPAVLYVYSATDFRNTIFPLA